MSRVFNNGLFRKRRKPGRIGARGGGMRARDEHERKALQIWAKAVLRGRVRDYALARGLPLSRFAATHQWMPRGLTKDGSSVAGPMSRTRRGAMRMEYRPGLRPSRIGRAAGMGGKQAQPDDFPGRREPSTGLLCEGKVGHRRRTNRSPCIRLLNASPSSEGAGQVFAIPSRCRDVRIMIMVLPQRAYTSPPPSARDRDRGSPAGAGREPTSLRRHR